MAFPKSRKYLDGEKLYTAYWKDMGGGTVNGGAASYRKMINYAVAHGMINPKNGKPPTFMGIWKAMWRWAIDNKDTAFKIAEDAYFTKGQVLERSWWEQEMIEKEKTSWQNENHTEKWTKQNAN